MSLGYWLRATWSFEYSHRIDSPDLVVLLEHKQSDRSLHDIACAGMILLESLDDRYVLGNEADRLRYDPGCPSSHHRVRELRNGCFPPGRLGNLNAGSAGYRRRGRRIADVHPQV